MKAIINRYYFEQRRALQENLMEVCETNDAETIHQLRLNVKRIRALFTFLSFVKGEKVGQPDLVSLKEIYRPAGKIRDIQVHMIHVRKYESRLKISYARYLESLEKRADEQYHRLRRAALDFAPDILEKLGEAVEWFTRDITDQLLENQVMKIFLEKLNEVRTLRQQSQNSRKNMHAMRKILKEVRYFLEIFQTSYFELQDIKLGYNRLKQMEKVLGLWHDQVNALRYLKAYRKQLSDDRLEGMRCMMLRDSVKSYRKLLKTRMLLAFDFELDPAKPTLEQM